MTDQIAKAVIRALPFASGLQIRAGRALLGWRRTDLAKAANLHPNAVAYWERRERLPRREELGCRRIREALSQAGVVAVTVPAPGVCLLPRSARPAPSHDAHGRRLHLRCARQTISGRICARVRAYACPTNPVSGSGG